MLKQLTWHYVIENPNLASLRYGQTQVIAKIFDVFMNALGMHKRSRDTQIFPIAYRERLEDSRYQSERDQVRTVIDLIASMTEQQVLKMYQRLMGVALGSALDPINL